MTSAGVLVDRTNLYGSHRHQGNRGFARKLNHIVCILAVFMSGAARPADPVDNVSKIDRALRGPILKAGQSARDRNGASVGTIARVEGQRATILFDGHLLTVPINALSNIDHPMALGITQDELRAIVGAVSRSQNLPESERK